MTAITREEHRARLAERRKVKVVEGCPIPGCEEGWTYPDGLCGKPNLCDWPGHYDEEDA